MSFKVILKYQLIYQSAFQTGWLHYDKKKNDYISVRTKKGGGTRDVSISMTSKANEIIAIAQSIFFPDGESVFGNLDTMVSSLGNFTCQEIQKDEFTLANYISRNSLTNVRLYLMTKVDDECIKPTKQQHPSNSLPMTCSPSVSFSAESSAMIDLTSTADVWNSSATHSFSTDHSTTPMPTKSSKLIGTSVQRTQIKNQQEEEYQASLNADKEKEKQKMQEKADMRRIEKLRDARKSRVPPEPLEGECNSVLISVRHLTLGIIKRKFKESDPMAVVYDWVGSLNESPENFTLSGCYLPELKPSSPVKIANKVLLNMAESDSAPDYPDQQVHFLGYGPESNCNDTLIDIDIPEIPPALLMQGDSFSRYVHCIKDKCFLGVYLKQESKC